MTQPRNVAVFVGSLRKESYNRKTAMALVQLAKPRLQLRIVEIGHFSPYNQDLDESPPSDWVALKRTIKNADAVLFVTPEYNRSIPGVLKNAIDIASRPYGDSAWDGKPGAIISVSPSAIGGFGANHHLRQSMVFLNVPTMQQPEAYIGGAADRFDDKGALVDDSTRDFLKTFLKAFAEWIELNNAEENSLKKAS